MKQIVRFILKFGPWTGLGLYIKISLKKTKKIKLPDIKYSIFLRSNTSDIRVFHEIFIDNEYDIPLDSAPKIVIDGGANVGLFAIKIKNKFPESKIICIEPDPENYQIVQRNLRFYDNVFIENKALWSKDINLRVYDKYDSGKWGMVVEETQDNGNISGISLKSLFKEYSIDYVDILKLDIETSEKILFSENYEEWLPKTKMIIIELHDRIEEGCAMAFFKALNKSIKKYSYNIQGESTIIVNNDIKSSESYPTQ